MMSVHAGFCFWLQDAVVRFEPCTDVAHRHRTAAVGDVDAMGTILLHQFGLLGKLFRWVQMGHHQKTADVHAVLTGPLNMLFSHVRFGAMSRHPDRGCPQLLSLTEIVDRADSRQQ